ncbi:beta-ketoacyl-ACP synthase II [bacterium]|nr:beta-ketoacyl-ACP synthase II [bacterium]
MPTALHRVVVTGMGVLSPIGNGLAEFEEGLYAGRSGTGPLTYFNPEGFSSRIAAQLPPLDMARWIDPKESDRMEPFVRYGVVASQMAVDMAGLDWGREDMTRVGVIVGSGIGGIAMLERQHEIYMQKGPRRISPLLIPMLIIDMASGMISMRFGAKGPNTAVVTACATGTHCIGEATRLIQRGDADVMLAGGTEAALTPLGFGGFCAMKALSTRNDDPAHASRPFDRDRDGFVMGEGAGVLVLESEGHARARGAEILGEVVGYGMSADAFHITQPAPEGEGAQRAMRAALADARIDPRDLDYINAHGTSTELNDKFETAAIKAVFGDHARRLMVSSTKSQTGPLLGAAGGVEAIATLLALARGVVPATINYQTPDPDCDLDYVPNTPREARISTALSNSFGFGGHNAVLAFRRYDGRG